MKQSLLILHTIILLKQFIQGDGTNTTQYELAISGSDGTFLLYPDEIMPTEKYVPVEKNIRPLTIVSDDDFTQKIEGNAAKLVIVHYMATWWVPCIMMTSIYENLSIEYPQAVFLNVDVDKCKKTEISQNVFGIPMFILYRDEKIVDRVIGVQKDVLKSKIENFYYAKKDKVKPATVQDTADIFAVGVPGYISLNDFINMSKIRYLIQHIAWPSSEESSEHSHDLNQHFKPHLTLFVPFNQPVNIHSLRITGPAQDGPKTIELFINLEGIISFDNINCSKPTQEIELKRENLEGEAVDLIFSQFQNVINLQIFVKDNQMPENVMTKIDEVEIIGLPANFTKTSQSKMVIDELSRRN